jgi:predicted transposase YdaD
MAWSRALGGLSELRRRADEHCRLRRLRTILTAWAVAEEEQSHRRSDLKLIFVAWSGVLGGLFELRRRADEHCRLRRLRTILTAWVVAEVEPPVREPVEVVTVFIGITQI